MMNKKQKQKKSLQKKLLFHMYALPASDFFVGLGMCRPVASKRQFSNIL